MRAPSLYCYFAPKNALYDAMFGQAWTAYLVPTPEASAPAVARWSECAFTSSSSGCRTRAASTWSPR